VVGGAVVVGGIVGMVGGIVGGTVTGGFVVGGTVTGGFVVGGTVTGGFVVGGDGLVVVGAGLVPGGGGLAATGGFPEDACAMVRTGAAASWAFVRANGAKRDAVRDCPAARDPRDAGGVDGGTRVVGVVVTAAPDEAPNVVVVVLFDVFGVSAEDRTTTCSLELTKTMIDTNANKVTVNTATAITPVRVPRFTMLPRSVALDPQPPQPG
jgi:hypothetical protein